MFSLNKVYNCSCQTIKTAYQQWSKFMEHNIEFWLPDSEWHTRSHCARVLILALLIGYEKGLSEEELDILGKVAVFHDSRRLNDGVDKGHGARAAAYYKEYCIKHDLLFDETSYYIIHYHDQEDLYGMNMLESLSDKHERGILLYQIFKDADALDRIRLGPDSLDLNFLRTQEALKLVDFSIYLFQTNFEGFNTESKS